MAKEGKTGSAWDNSIERGRSKEQSNYPAGERSATIKPTVVGSVRTNPTMGGGITRPTKGQK